MIGKPCVYFYYRSPTEILLGGYLVVLDTSSLMEWFQMGWHEAARVGSQTWIEDQLGRDPFGLSSFFEEVKYRKLLPPTTAQGLNLYLEEYFSSNGEHVYDGATFRARALVDGDVDLAYYFFESQYAENHPAVVSFILTGERGLPAALDDRYAAQTRFVCSVKLKAITPAGSSAGTLYGAFLTYYAEEALTLRDSFFIQGLRLGDLIPYLLNANPCTGADAKDDEERLQGWPDELQILRAYVEEQDISLGELFRRAEPSFVWNATSWAPRHSARKVAMERIQVNGGDAEDECHVIQDEEHFFYFRCHKSKTRNLIYILFDDIWASAHPALAESILRYSTSWDPFANS